ncbi:hypothetical protein SHKM778_76930 [Streptomyces sp. KM77-8]|uniref:Uncharacterized protein n=1 Tax=Streptomyces haneummycinicus TaxID=3074435 RepID=A0AAT9HUP4_9ACTN
MRTRSTHRFAPPDEHTVRPARTERRRTRTPTPGPPPTGLGTEGTSGVPVFTRLTSIRTRLTSLRTCLAPLRTRLSSPRTRLRAVRDAHPAAARTARWTLHALAAALVVGALLMPNTAPGLRPDGFTRIPAEAIVGAVLLIALPRRPRIVVAALYGAGIGVLTLLNLLDMGFTEYLGRGFNVVLDWGLLDDAQAYVADSMGSTAATAAAVGAVVLTLLLVTVMALATVRLGNLLARHRPAPPGARCSRARCGSPVPRSACRSPGCPSPPTRRRAR